VFGAQVACNSLLSFVLAAAKAKFKCEPQVFTPFKFHFSLEVAGVI
jgi:hypothetical protein